MLGSPILYLKGMRILMFQLSGFYYRSLGFRGLGFRDYRSLMIQDQTCQLVGIVGI